MSGSKWTRAELDAYLKVGATELVMAPLTVAAFYLVVFGVLPEIPLSENEQQGARDLVKRIREAHKHDLEGLL